ncbi:MAG: thioesterase family protein [Myxococcales bacterium]|nr:thioesterase family protein [Myxococcales bacterium]
MDYRSEVLGALDPAGTSLVVPEVWEGVPGTSFGGYAVAALFASARLRAEQPRPLSVHARFHRPVPVTRTVGVRVERERRGRMVEVFSSRLGDGDRPLVSASVAFGAPSPVTDRSQPVEPMLPIDDPVPVFEVTEALGVRPANMMRHVGFRTSRRLLEGGASGDWHLLADWPSPTEDYEDGYAIAAIMCIDAFPPAASMFANGYTITDRWQVMPRSVDVTAWFYGSPATASRAGRLDVRTSVASTGAGFAVGRTQVWAEQCLVAEGMSQVVLLPASEA